MSRSTTLGEAAIAAPATFRPLSVAGGGGTSWLRGSRLPVGRAVVMPKAEISLLRVRDVDAELPKQQEAGCEPFGGQQFVR